MTPSSLFGGFGAGEEALSVSTSEQPASPTAPLAPFGLFESALNSGSRASKRRSLGRRVQFDAETKRFDGLGVRAKVLDEIIKRFFVMQREVSELDVIELCAKDARVVAELGEDLRDLAQRVEVCLAEGKGAVPVLPRGGGMCTKLCPQHLPYVKTLTAVVEAAAKRAARLSVISKTPQ